ncbi:ADP-ribosyltransferase [Priestia endophytica]|uniref:ADP-ribosyltransferase n=1 Tax=Priestia endophytica TaxID=135735 RepID=UPI002E1BB030|nr:ADP-ribosyltransferase [Priestia endophytica]MED4069929.1 ADP-ribosyltransferase [Priestia endophytica]
MKVEATKGESISVDPDKLDDAAKVILSKRENLETLKESIDNAYQNAREEYPGLPSIVHSIVSDLKSHQATMIDTAQFLKDTAGHFRAIDNEERKLKETEDMNWFEDRVDGASEWVKDTGESISAAFDKTIEDGKEVARETDEFLDDATDYIMSSPFVKGVEKGIKDAGTDFWEGVSFGVMHPIQTLKGAFHSIIHPIETGKDTWNYVSNSFMDNIVHGDTESRTAWITYGVVGLVGAKGIDKAAKGAAAVGKSAGSVSKASKSSPHTKKASKKKSVPHSTVSTTVLKKKFEEVKKSISNFIKNVEVTTQNIREVSTGDVRNAAVYRVETYSDVGRREDTYRRENVDSGELRGKASEGVSQEERRAEASKSDGPDQSLKNEEVTEGDVKHSGSHDQDIKNELLEDGSVDDNSGTIRVEESSNKIETIEEAHEWGSTYYDGWIDTLTEEERRAITRYTGPDHIYINHYLRGIIENPGDVPLQVIENVKKGLDKAEVPHDMQVYRGTSKKPLEYILEYNQFGQIEPESLIGKSIRDNAFVSTAIVKELSFSKDVSWEINVPEGTHAAYVAKISRYPNEAELLLNAGQEMIIKEAELDKRGKLHIVVDLK